jgi:hypothetical protein
MVKLDLMELVDLPCFTVAERQRIDAFYQQMRAKHDCSRAGVKQTRAPPDFYRDNADKIRYAQEAAGVTGQSMYR